MTKNNNNNNLAPKKFFLQKFSSNTNLVISEVVSLAEEREKKPVRLWRPFDVEEKEEEESSETSKSSKSQEFRESSPISIISDKTEESKNMSCEDIEDLPEDIEMEVQSPQKLFKTSPNNLKNRKFQVATEQLNQKFLKLLRNKARQQKQTRVMIRSFMCTKCGFKTYIKKIIDHHLTIDLSCRKSDFVLHYEVMRT